MRIAPATSQEGEHTLPFRCGSTRSASCRYLDERSREVLRAPLAAGFLAAEGRAELDFDAAGFLGAVLAGAAFFAAGFAAAGRLAAGFAGAAFFAAAAFLVAGFAAAGFFAADLAGAARLAAVLAGAAFFAAGFAAAGFFAAGFAAAVLRAAADFEAAGFAAADRRAAGLAAAGFAAAGLADARPAILRASALTRLAWVAVRFAVAAAAAPAFLAAEEPAAPAFLASAAARLPTALSVALVDFAAFFVEAAAVFVADLGLVRTGLMDSPPLVAMLATPSFGRQLAIRFRRRRSRSLMPPHTPYRSSRRSA